jgi:hypothetical protein
MEEEEGDFADYQDEDSEESQEEEDVGSDIDSSIQEQKD